MGIVIERRRATPATELTELVTPRTNEATITPVENMLAANTAPGPFSLELAATPARRRFLVRAGCPEAARHLARQAGAAYPQAELRHTDSSRDPALTGFGEQVVACVLELREAVYLPIRTFPDQEVDDERSAQADPVLGLLGAMGDLPRGWRALSQLVLRPAPDGWARPYLRLATGPPHNMEGSGTSLTPLVGIAGLGLALVAGLNGYVWYGERD